MIVSRKKFNSYGARIHFLRLKINYFNFFSQTETSYVRFSFFRNSKTFFKFDSNQLKNLFFVHVLLGTRSLFTSSGANTLFLDFFFAILHPNQDFKRLFLIFFRSSETIFLQILFLPTSKTFICTSFSIVKNYYFIWLEKAVLDFFFLRTMRLQTLVFHFNFCNMEIYFSYLTPTSSKNSSLHTFWL